MSRQKTACKCKLLEKLYSHFILLSNNNTFGVTKSNEWWITLFRVQMDILQKAGGLPPSLQPIKLISQVPVKLQQRVQVQTHSKPIHCHGSLYEQCPFSSLHPYYDWKNCFPCYTMKGGKGLNIKMATFQALIMIFSVADPDPEQVWSGLFRSPESGSGKIPDLDPDSFSIKRLL